MSGTLKISFGGKEYDLGIVESISERYNKSVATTPIPTMSEDATYAIESDSSIVVTVEFSRVTPDSGTTSGSDSTKWTNGYWYEEIQKIMNRWQARTNGCKLTYTPGADNPYIPARNYNGYIKTLSRMYQPGDPTVIYVTMEFHVGTMTVQKKTSTQEPSYAEDYEIIMSNGDRTQWFALMKGSVNCISSYTIEGGMEQPFESITMEIPKNRLTSVAEGLVDNIIAGKSKMVMKAVGTSTMTVTKCKLSGKTYYVTAYCDAEAIKGYTLDIESSYTPWYWIKYIITSGEYGMSYLDQDDGRTFFYTLNPAEGDYDDITFKKGQNIWYILQVCALYLGCKIFFANGCAYCVDYRLSSVSAGSTYTANAFVDYADLDLYTDKETNALYGRVTGPVTLGNEGIDTVINTQVIQCVDTEGKSVTVEYKAPGITVSRSGNKLPISELIQGGGYEQATTLAKNLVDYRLEPQQSISFRLKEMQDSGSQLAWQPFFSPSARADMIRSIADDVTITNMSEDGKTRRPQKLLLSQYERSYPEGYTKYTFGIISNIDLAVSTSQILSSQQG